MFVGEIMKKRIIEILLIGLILFMSAGIFTSIKNDNNNEITEVVSELENEDIYETSGYISNYPYNQDNDNAIGEINGKIGNGISKAINKMINGFFDLVKKLVS